MVDASEGPGGSLGGHTVLKFGNVLIMLLGQLKGPDTVKLDIDFQLESL